MKNEILPFVTWMDLEGIMLNEISQMEKDYYMISLKSGIYKTKQTTKQGHRYREQMGGCRRGGMSPKLVKRIKRYKPPLINKPWASNKQHKEYS